VHQVPLTQANGNELGYDWAPPAFRRAGEMLDGFVVVPPKGYATVPRTLLDGTLRAPRPMGAHGDWICDRDWDFLVYAFSNGKGRSYAGRDAMKEFCGIGSYDYYLIGPAQVEAIRGGLWDRLIHARLAVPSGRFLYGYQEYDLLIPPQVSADRLRPTGIRATVANMEAEGENYVRVPRAVFLDLVWKQIRTHELRRLLAAMYVFNDLTRFGGIDPEELRLEESTILMSDAFMKAAGQDDPVRVACCIDYLSSRCGLANWIGVHTSVASTRPGEQRLVYMGDADDSTVAVLRPTLQTSEEWEGWLSRQEKAG